MTRTSRFRPGGGTLMRRHSAQAGFTLIEIMVVVVIIGLLVVVGVMAFAAALWSI